MSTRRAELQPNVRPLPGSFTGDVPDAPRTGLTVFAMATDPELVTIATESGRVAFLQLVGVGVGVTQVEKERMVASSTNEVLTELGQTDPLLITDPARARTHALPC